MLLLSLISPGLTRTEHYSSIIHWSIGNRPHTTYFHETLAYLGPCLRAAHRHETGTKNLLNSHLPLVGEVPLCY